MFQQVQVLSMEAPSHHRSYTRRREGRPTRRKPGRKSLRWPFGDRSVREASNFAGRSESETGSPEIIPLLGAYSGDVISTFRRDVNSHSDDVNKVGAQRR